MEFLKTLRYLKYKNSATTDIDVKERGNIYRNMYPSRSNMVLNFYDNYNPRLDSTISMQELLMSIQKAKAGKPAGRDEININFYKNLPSNWLHYLLNLFNNIIRNEDLSSKWSHVTSTALHGK